MAEVLGFTKAFGKPRDGTAPCRVNIGRKPQIVSVCVCHIKTNADTAAGVVGGDVGNGSVARSFGNEQRRSRRERQMTAIKKIFAGAVGDQMKQMLCSCTFKIIIRVAL